MTGRYIKGSPKAAGVAKLSLAKRRGISPARNRRTMAAFLTGLGLLGLGFGSLEAGIAAGVINPLNSPISFITGQVQNRVWRPDGSQAGTPIAWNLLDSSAGHKRSGASVAKASERSSSLPRRSVCVRLCDGYYFPVGPLSRADDLPNHEAACSGLCPDAPTQLFIEPAGSDRIEDAVSSNGARYGALPVAFRNRTRLDNTCTCHRRPGQTFSLLDDFTLRKGDSIMTPAGIIVFRGASRLPYAQDDFTALAKASMPKDKREILAAIERATLPTVRQSGNATSPPRRSEIAFNASLLSRSPQAPINKSIHFVASTVSASN
jgi:hypothetical protein